MKIALIHYHLKPGGVTTAIRQQAEAAGHDCEILIITGEPPDVRWPLNAVHIPGIAYDGVRPSGQDPETVADAVERAIFHKWSSGCDLLHVHNPLLKKNKDFLLILELLQHRGHRLLLQIHDFAEDGRPDAYYQGPYPRDCHYAVINSRDYRILRRAGLLKKGLHKIANMVGKIPETHSVPAVKPSVVYPIRGIRRKNIGEAILLSLFMNRHTELNITLPPNSPVDLMAYQSWKRFAARQRLPVVFDAGLKQDFASLVASASFLISTSISEGFGFSFLEPWTAGKALWGRDLPEITIDFKQAGVALNHLYPALRVPASMALKQRFADQWRSCLARNCRRYGFSVDKKSRETALAGILEAPCIDFGLLNESFQKEIIIRVLFENEYKISLMSLNSFLAEPDRINKLKTLVENNRIVIGDRYSESAYRETLLKAYRRVCRCPVTHGINKKNLLESFFRPKHFSLLKWDAYAE